MANRVKELRKECIGLIGRMYIYHGTCSENAGREAAKLVDALIRAVQIQEENVGLDASGQRVSLNEYLGIEPIPRGQP